MAGIVIRAGREHESPLLTELAVRSTAHWGYGPQELDRRRPHLALQPEHMASRHVTVAERDGRILGFYAVDCDPAYAEVAMFFVDPPDLGKGVGRLLWEHLLQTARALGVDELALGADPRAAGFYLRMGMHRQGEIVHEGMPLVWMVRRLSPA